MDYGDWKLGPTQFAQALTTPPAAQYAPTTDEIAKALQGQYWKRTWEGSASDPEIVMVDKSPWGDGVKGWTACDKDKRSCQIMLLKNAANRECVEKHERMHAAGIDHPDYPRGFVCN